MRPFLHCTTDATCDHLPPKRAPISLHSTSSCDYYPSGGSQQTEGPSVITKKEQHKKEHKEKQSASDAPSPQQSDIQIFPSFFKIKNCVSLNKTSRHSSISTSCSISSTVSSQIEENEVVSETQHTKSSSCCFQSTFDSNLDPSFKETKMKYELMRSKDSSVDYKLRIGPPSPRIGGSFKKSTESRLTFTLSIGLLLCLAVALTISFHISESLYHEREKHQKETKKASKEMMGRKRAHEQHEYQVFLQEATHTDMSIPTVFFSQHHISAVPRGFSDEDFFSWKDGLMHRHVVDVVAGCGRMFNRLLILDDGSKACCRYRQNQDQIQGEVFSFYLSRAIGINSVAPTKLTIVNFSDPFWASASSKLTEAQWVEGKLVILTEFIDNLLPVAVPKYFQHDQNSVLDWFVVQNSSNSLTNRKEALPANQIVDLIQWSDMILFDYLTGNLDRVVNNLFNLKWNSKMMQQPIHNLEKRGSDGLFLLFDNESGLLHSYRLLDKYSEFHEQLLKSLCMFKPVTVDNIRFYENQSTLWTEMYSDFQRHEPLAPKLPKIPARFLQTLQSRLANTVEHFDNCEARIQTNVTAINGDGSKT